MEKIIIILYAQDDGEVTAKHITLPYSASSSWVLVRRRLVICETPDMAHEIWQKKLNIRWFLLQCTSGIRLRCTVLWIPRRFACNPDLSSWFLLASLLVCFLFLCTSWSQLIIPQGRSRLLVIFCSLEIGEDFLGQVLSLSCQELCFQPGWDVVKKSNPRETDEALKSVVQ